MTIDKIGVKIAMDRMVKTIINNIIVDDGKFLI